MTFNFDVLLDGRFVRSFHYPVPLGGVIDSEKLYDYIASLEPRLKGKDYQIKF